ncbi:hypothetical protein OEZ86_013469 [Tetradesmus obliquus]|nr:hypothetical protein OEZ86_013469 [Tetradesmus obliquus]
MWKQQGRSAGVLLLHGAAAALTHSCAPAYLWHAWMLTLKLSQQHLPAHACRCRRGPNAASAAFVGRDSAETPRSSSNQKQ